MRQANRASPSSPFYHYFSSPPYQHLFYHTSNAISTQILYVSEISINSPINITITWHIFNFRDRFYKTLKLAIKALKCIFFKNLFRFFYKLPSGFSFTRLANICTEG